MESSRNWTWHRVPRRCRSPCSNISFTSIPISCRSISFPSKPSCRNPSCRSVSTRKSAVELARLSGAGGARRHRRCVAGWGRKPIAERPFGSYLRGEQCSRQPGPPRLRAIARRRREDVCVRRTPLWRYSVISYGPKPMANGWFMSSVIFLLASFLPGASTFTTPDG